MRERQASPSPRLRHHKNFSGVGPLTHSPSPHVFAARVQYGTGHHKQRGGGVLSSPWSAKLHRPHRHNTMSPPDTVQQHGTAAVKHPGSTASLFPHPRRFGQPLTAKRARIALKRACTPRPLQVTACYPKRASTPRGTLKNAQCASESRCNPSRARPRPQKHGLGHSPYFLSSSDCVSRSRTAFFLRSQIPKGE